MKINRWRFLLLALALVPFAGLAAQQKYALVIGNGAYTNITKLNNPVNDANDMATALRSLGFQVDTVLNGSLDQMENAVIRLKNRLSITKDAYGFFFYAGHGVQSNGQNYLIPVDSAIASESFLRQRAVQMQAVLDELNQAGNRLNIVVLDACRDNPFSWARSGSRGLQVVDNQPADSIIVYATSAGSTAADGTGRNGLFTEQLLKNIRTPGLEVSELFRRTGSDVSRVSNRKQIPAVYNQFFETAYLSGPAPSPQPAPAPQAPRNVRAGTPGTDSVSLTWDSAGSGVSYKVYYGTQNDASRASVLNNVTTGTSMNVSGMASASTYYFWVTAVQNGQESGKSPVLTIRTAAVPVQPNIPADMVRIPAGTFTMGSPTSEPSRISDEVQHSVTISKAFYMGKYEVTQKEWVSVMGSNPSGFKGDNLPVECVSWFDVIDYCNKRSVKEGLTQAYTRNGDTVTWNRNANGYRLPTEAEWEYACRAGTATPFSTGSNITTSQANYNGDYPYNGNSKGTYRGETTPVGSFAPNNWGLYDMHGNVLEWCWDWYGDYSSSSQTDPMGAASVSDRVWRGGSGHIRCEPAVSQSVRLYALGSWQPFGLSCCPSLSSAQEQEQGTARGAAETEALSRSEVRLRSVGQHEGPAKPRVSGDFFGRFYALSNVIADPL
ncbi:SUMF1/EgtB/PvdO family nonheme iron enzyme [Breznakiellaceae bacterium SP9]